ncbi:SET and MYND domain-containing protein 4 [Microdochium nivale]|nr:SET and MYND domain-containing protein 4 [Microdochium nivale]
MDANDMASENNAGQLPHDRKSDSPEGQVKRLESCPKECPSRSDDIVALHNLKLQPDAETTSSSRSSTIKMATASYLPPAYPPSTKPLSKLEPISIFELEPDTHHRGRRTTLRVLAPPYREHVASIATMVEDEQGDTLVLRLFFQPPEQLVPADEILCMGDVVVVREPFFCKSAADSGSCALRVDHTGDVTRLAVGNERIPTRWRCVEEQEEVFSGVLRGQGNEAVREEQWAKAHRLYTSAIQAAATLEDEQMAYLNRSLTNLRLGRPAAALSDAQAAASDNDNSNHNSSLGLAEKALFRTARAQYDLGDFTSCLATLERLATSHPDNPATAHEIRRTRARLHEQETGTYSFRGMYTQATAAASSTPHRPPPLIDCATYSSRVAVRPSSSPGRGSGLFTTGPVAAGDLLLVEKAFGYGYAPEGGPGAGSMLLDVAARKGFVGGQVALLARLVDKISHDPEARRALCELYAGGHGIPGVEEEELDGAQAVVDSFLVAKIISFNAFGAPISSRDALAQRINLSPPPPPSPTDTPTSSTNATTTNTTNAFASSSLWLLASRINHSCHGNCRRSFIGDVQIVRAARDLPAPGGTELLFGYRAAQHGESHADVQDALRRHWGFECGCELCAVRAVTTQGMLDRRRVLMGELHDVLLGEDGDDDGESETGRGAGRRMDVDTAQRILREMETETYPPSAAAAAAGADTVSDGGTSSSGVIMRLELWDPYFALGAEMLGRGEPEGCITMILRGLESLGFVIITTAAVTKIISTALTAPSDDAENGTGSTGVADRKKKKKKKKKSKKQNKNKNNNNSMPAPFAGTTTTTTIAAPTAVPALEIVTWGYVTDLVPLAFLQLAAAYASLEIGARGNGSAVAVAAAASGPKKTTTTMTTTSRCSEAARGYARTAYSILVGEAETFGDDEFALFGA